MDEDSKQILNIVGINIELINDLDFLLPREQLLSDLNGNDIPEYIICGFSSSMLQQNEKGPHFLTIFEQTGAGIQRLYLQKLLVAPVTLDFSKDPTRKGIIVSFAFYSDYSAEIYFEGNEYHLEKLF